MMRKLAVTVFAMSLTLIGCGSSSSSKKDAAPDATKDVISTLDTTPSTNEVGGSEVKAGDVAVDSATDAAPKADVSDDGTTVSPDTRDGGAGDRTPDTFVKLDGNTVVKLDALTDAPKTDTNPVNGDAGDDAGDAN